MKKLFYTLLSCCAVAMLFSCKKEAPVNPYADSMESLVLKYSESQMQYNPVESEGVLVFDTKESLTATSSKDWCVPTVNGNTVTLNLSANSGKLTRYAQVSVKSANASLVVDIVQLGEVMAGLASLSDVTAAVEGQVVTIPVKLNVEVEFQTEEDWIHPVVDGNDIVITIDPNPDPLTRSGIVYYTAGSQSGSFEVTQYPELVKKDDWNLALTGTSFVYPEFSANTDVTVGDADMYVIYMVPKSTVGDDVEGYIFNDLAVTARRQILEQVESAGGEFKDYLEKGSQKIDIDGINVGENYLIAIGFADNGYVTGQYQFAEVTIDDIRPDYYKWAGKWKLTGTYFDNSEYSEEVTIAVDETDVNDDGTLKEARLIIYGLLSKAANAWTAPEDVNKFYLKYNAETGAIIFYGQNATGTFNRSSGPNWRLQLMSMYVKAGATAYTSATGFDILSATLDGTTGAKIEVLERSAGLPWLVLRMRALNEAGSAYTNTNANNAGIFLDEPLTMTRVQ